MSTITRRQEKELEARGYRIKECFDFRGSQKAKLLAQDLRSKGYYARVAEYSTMVAGLHDYAVWCKYKGV